MSKSTNPEKKVQDKLYKYGAKVLNAKLDGSAKALLWFYAYVFNWEGSIPSWYAQRKICALTGMSQSTYHTKRKYLEELGWIEVLNRGFSESCLVRVKEGRNDPNYENMSWAQWHPDNAKNDQDDEVSEFLSGASEVFQTDDSSQEYSSSARVQDDPLGIVDDFTDMSW